MRRITALLTMLLLIAACLPARAADRLPDPIPWPDAGSLSENGTMYQDGSITVLADTIRLYETDIVVAWIRVSDAAQVRTALAAPFPSKKRRTTEAIANENGAVLALSGDFFSYHNEGIVMRNGVLLRNQPVKSRDTLLIDRNGDFSILHPTTREAFDQVRENVREAFCFGPWLVSRGEKLTDYRQVRQDLDANGRHIRLFIGQTAPLSYVVVSSEGPEHPRSLGLTLKQAANVAEALGCREAYNLDGGSSATVMLNGRQISHQARQFKMRPVGDIIYFASLNGAADE